MALEILRWEGAAIPLWSYRGSPKNNFWESRGNPASEGCTKHLNLQKVHCRLQE